MAHVSRFYSSTWRPDGDGDEKGFAATIGRVISHNTKLYGAKELRTSELGTRPLLAPSQTASQKQRQQQQQQQQATSTHGQARDVWLGPRPGFVWVNSKGHTLIEGPPATPQLPLAPPPPLPPAAQQYASLSAGERSMRIWKRISPGMLPGTSQTPLSTTQSAYAYPGDLLEPVDMTHHLRKTDFSEYVEAREKQHVSLKAKS